MRQLTVTPMCSLPEAHNLFAGHVLSRSHYRTLVATDTVGRLDGEVKFLYLRGVIPPGRAWEIFTALSRLRYYNVEQTNRSALHHGHGGELPLGWINRPQPRIFAKTYAAPATYFYTLSPLLNAMSGLLRQHLPEYWAIQAQAARRNDDKVLGAEWLQPDTVAVYRPGFLGTKLQMLPAIFSTITINKGTLCRSHADAGNESGLACLTAVGDFTGGELCFPRFGVAFPMRPGDVLIADTNKEQHGNVGPLCGKRISVVAYLRGMTG